VNTNGLSVSHMGITPYITASIAVSFALASIPELRQWRKEAGAEGSDIISQWGRRIGLACSFVQGLWTAWQLRPFASGTLAAMPLLQYMLCTALPLTAGTSSLMWLAEEITRTGIGQGMSMVISLSCIASYAVAARQLLPALFVAGSGGTVLHVPTVAAALGAITLQTCLAVLVTEGVRKVPISFFQLQGGATAGVLAQGSQQQGEALSGDHIPLRINPSGIQPVLFAICLLDGIPWVLSAAGAPAALQAGLAWLLDTGGVLYYLLYAFAVFAFAFLDLEDLPTEMAEYLLKCGARVPGVRPGEATVAYLRHQQFCSRAWGGALLALLSVLSQLADKTLQRATGVGVGFTGLLIITSTVLQCRRQVRALSEKPKLGKTLEML
jgi:preprotein translocase subunit SecY